MGKDKIGRWCQFCSAGSLIFSVFSAWSPVFAQIAVAVFFAIVAIVSGYFGWIKPWRLKRKNERLAHAFKGATVYKKLKY